MDGETVVQTLHRFDQLANECVIQALPLSEDNKAMILLTHPSEKWRGFIDSYATQDPLPTVSVIFRAMKAQEERWNARNDEKSGKPTTWAGLEEGVAEEAGSLRQAVRQGCQ